MKIKLLCVLVVGSLLLMACRGNVNVKSEEVKIAIQRGNDIVIAIEAYKSKHGLYPDQLEQLVPVFLSTVPETGITRRESYIYVKVLDDVDRPYRYSLSFPVARAPRALKVVTFNPAQMYEDTDIVTTHAVMGEWAVQTIYRSPYYNPHYKGD